MKAILLMVVSCALAQTPGAAMRQAMEQQQTAAKLQRESVRMQAESFRYVQVVQPPPECDAVPESKLAGIVDAAAKANGLESKLVRAIVDQESGGRACAVSVKGARGLMQLMPSTVAQFSVQDPMDPEQNVRAGAKHFKQLLERFKGDLDSALGAYNAGGTAVEQAGGIPDFAETRAYVQAVRERAGLKRTDPPNSPPPKPTGN
jgi:soluble lytic murein transglycosylase-like protein